MPDEEPVMHFGLNCRYLRRDEYPPANGRCVILMQHFAGTRYEFLDAKTPVQVDVAARFLGIPRAEVVRRAKAGELEYSFPDSVERRVTLFTKKGAPVQVTVKEAAKRLRKSPAEIEAQISAGDLEAEYPDGLMRVVLVNRWEYEQCPLLHTGGVCAHFEAHDGPQIGCMADAALPAGE